MTGGQATILVVDDTPANLAQMSGLLQPEFRVKVATDGERALRIARNVPAPDLILLDIVMPGMNGHEVCQALKADPLTRDIPVIFLTARADTEDEATGLNLGAVDYITKPVSPTIALARIRTHLTLYRQHLEILESQRKLAVEIGEAAEYIRSLLPPPIEGAVRTAWQHLPSSSLGGDAFGYHWIDDDHLAIYLLDVCGHGVGAALLSISAINALRSQSLQDTDFLSPAAVLAGLNRSFPMEAQNNKYFTAWYGVWQASRGRLRFSSAGHPPALLFRPCGPDPTTPEQLTVRNVAIGTTGGWTFREAEVALAGPCKLYVLSDGVFEIEHRDGGEWGFFQFLDELRQFSDPARLQSGQVLGRMQALNRQGTTFADDFSLLELVFTAPARHATDASGLPPGQEPGPATHGADPGRPSTPPRPATGDFQ